MKLPLPVLLTFAPCLLTAAEITAKLEDKQVVVRSGDAIVLRYQYEPAPLPRPDIPAAFIRGGYIQEIRTPSGRLITDDFPADHFHHHGVWNPWTKTEFEGRHPDFWNMGDKTGRIEAVGIDDIWETNHAAGFVARHRSIDMSATPEKVALLDTWNVDVSAKNGAYIIDFTSKQTCATSSPLKLLQYRYGGFGFRGSAAWNGKDNWQLLTASGLTDRTKIDTAREKWCWVGGKVDGEVCGVLILCHPSNDRFPQPIRANPDQPFFCYTPVQLGDYEIKPGTPYVSRYRMVVMDGAPKAEDCEKRWSEYAALPAKAD